MALRDIISTDIKNIFMNSNDFAEPFTFSRSGLTINAIFDDEFLVVIDGVESSRPIITVADSDIAGIKHADTFTRTGTSIIYNVIGIQPDGTGMTMIILSQD